VSALLAQTFLGFPLSVFLTVAAVAAVASIIGGIAGYGTGMLLPLALVPAIGAEATVPVIGVTAIFTNLGRVAAFRHDIDWPLTWRVALPALPAVVLGASFNAWLSGRGVLVLLGLTLLVMIPLRRWIAGSGWRVQPWAIPLIGIVFGLLTGGTTGSGVILIAITGTVKSLTFGTLGALTPELLVFAVIVGLVTLPSGFAARAILRVLPMKVHAALLDGVIVIGGLSFLWRGMVS
jgi:uncharacterized protein